jgi:tetratricopeptide (TPR) repeat protein
VSKPGDGTRSAVQLEAEAELWLQQGDVDNAAENFQQAIVAFRRDGECWEAASLGHRFGRTLVKAQRWEKGYSFLERAIPDYHAASKRPSKEGAAQHAVLESALLNVADCRWWLGYGLFWSARYPEAIVNLRRATLAFDAWRQHRRAADGYLMWGNALTNYGLATKKERPLRMALKKFALAEESFKEAQTCGEQGAELARGQCFLSSATALLALDMPDAIVEGYPAAKAIFGRYGDEKQRAWCEQTYRTAAAAKANSRL